MKDALGDLQNVIIELENTGKLCDPGYTNEFVWLFDYTKPSQCALDKPVGL